VRSVLRGDGGWSGSVASLLLSRSRIGLHGGVSSCSATASGDAISGARGMGSFTGGTKMYA
jgi:hypothetical protein